MLLLESARALLALPDRDDFGFTRGWDPEPLPDHTLLFDLLTREAPGLEPLHYEQV